MTINYEITSDEEHAGATIVINGDTFTVADSHPQWGEISVGLLSKKFKGREKDLRLLVNPGLMLNGELSRLSDRLAYRNGKMYVDGDVTDNALTRLIAKMINEAGSVISSDGTEPVFMPFIRFAENLFNNPSKDSQEHLFHFINANGINITPDGHFVAYKGVNSDRTSKSAGYGIVNGTAYESAQLPNPDGAVVEIPRSMVDANRGVACSVGLHAGDFSYADGFKGGGVLLNVKINPRDVVSVPKDAQDRKIRVCRYTVLGVNQGKIEKVVFEDQPVEPGSTSDTKIGAPGRAVQEDDQSVDDAEATVEDTEVQKRTQRMIEYIKDLPKGANYRRVRNKVITAKNRIPFDEAMKILNLTY